MKRVREYTTTLSCEYCGGIFSAASTKAKYCCAAHRTAAKRQGDRVALQASRLRATLDAYEVEFVVQNKETRSEAINELRGLQEHLNIYLSLWAE